MPKFSHLLVFSTFMISVAAAGASAGAAVGYDLSNPSSTGCASKGVVQYPATARAYGPFSIRLRRSTTCNTVWAHITRTDTKRCQAGGLNCAQIRLTRTLGNGTKTATGWRKMAGGTKAVLSLQLNGMNDAKYVANASTFGGTTIGASGTISVDRNGNWSSS